MKTAKRFADAFIAKRLLPKTSFGTTCDEYLKRGGSTDQIRGFFPIRLRLRVRMTTPELCQNDGFGFDL